jgi:hypothetical protein
MNMSNNIDRYIEQLLEDLEAVAANPPKPAYIEIPPDFDNDPSIAELGLVPYKTIEELTGIKQEAFPHFHDLYGRHWRALLEAIFQVFDSLNIKLIDAPLGIPKEWLYDVITTNWQCEVQYLPQSGMDLEFCTGDPMSCPYGSYCDCGVEWPDDEEYFEPKREISEHYEAMLPKMAEVIDNGLICILFADNLELKTLTKDVYEDPEKFGVLIGLGNDVGETCEIDVMREKFTVEPLLRYEIVQIMETFTNRLLDDKGLQKKLNIALGENNPIERFNSIIQRSSQNGYWLRFKKAWIEDYIRAVIWQSTKDDNDTSDDFETIIDYDGVLVNSDLIPTPDLCMFCKSFYADKGKENVLCILHRYDMSTASRFRCGAFEEIE